MSKLFVDIDEKDKINNEILERHILKYIKSVEKVLATTFFIVLISEIVVAILVKFGFFLYHLKNKSGNAIPFITFISEQIRHEIYTWATFFIYFLLARKANFSQRKTLLCALSIIIATIYCFGHWKNNYLSFLYSLPIIIAIPFDKKRNLTVMWICIVLIVIYTFFQNAIKPNETNFLIGTSAAIAVVALQLICIKLHNTMNNAFMDIKDYAIQQKILNDKLAHDVLTGAYSKTALETDTKELAKYKSLAFIDLDNFKSINDKMGHSMGDNILKLLVFCLNTKNNKVYRYGGDEFVVLSDKESQELKNVMEKLKTKFTYYSLELFNIKATVSAGIITVNPEETGAQNLERCDNLMYKSKDKGKDTLTLEC